MTDVSSLRFALPCVDLLRARATAGRFSPHLHSTFSIVVLRNGSARIWSRRWSKTVDSGHVFFFNPYEVHAAVVTHGAAEYEVLYPSEAFTQACAMSHSDGCLRIETDVLSQTSETRALTDALQGPDLNDKTIDGPVRRILQSCTFSVEPFTSTPDGVARKACSIIGENRTRAIRTEDLADEVGVHRSHLVRAFTASLGIAPQTYIRQVRIAKARDLICTGSTLSQAAHALGFCDQAHLTREFKKVFGVAPGALARGIGRRDANPVQDRAGRAA